MVVRCSNRLGDVDFGEFGDFGFHIEFARA